MTARPTALAMHSMAFSPRPTASSMLAQGKAALAAAALGLVRKRSTQPEGLPHHPPQTPRSIVNQRGFSIRCSLLGGPHQPMFPHPPRRPSARATLPRPENHRKSGLVALKIILACFAGGDSLPLIDAGHRFSRRPKPRRQPLNSSTKSETKKRDQRPDKNPQVPTFRPSTSSTANRQPTTDNSSSRLFH